MGQKSPAKPLESAGLSNPKDAGDSRAAGDCRPWPPRPGRSPAAGPRPGGTQGPSVPPPDRGYAAAFPGAVARRGCPCQGRRGGLGVPLAEGPGGGGARPLPLGPRPARCCAAGAGAAAKMEAAGVKTAGKGSGVRRAGPGAAAAATAAGGSARGRCVGRRRCRAGPGRAE